MTRALAAQREDGQASIELLGLLPLLFLAMLGALQVAFAYSTVVATDAAARAAARAESRGDSPVAAARAAVPGWLADHVQVSSADGRSVRVTAPIPIVMPLPGLPSGPRVARVAYFPSPREQRWLG